MMSLDSLKSIFIECQDSQNHHQLTKAFCKIYHACAFEDFWNEFLRLVKHPMVVYGREVAVERTITFIAKAVTDLALLDSKEAKSKRGKSSGDDDDDDTIEEDGDDEMHPLLLKFFEFLLEVYSAKERGVRFRVCQFITLMLQNLGEGAQIDDVLYDRIYQCLIERLRDKCTLVRVHAVLALTRLQDPSDEMCPVTKAYIILMTRDPHTEVRRVILTCIAPSVTSLSAILERTHDVNANVRRTAFTVIAEKVPLRALKIEQRIHLLQEGLNDRSELVQAACANKLLQVWLSACDGNILDLLARLDVQSSFKVCEKALSILFKNSGVLDLVQQFDIINDRALIEEEKLTCEAAFYWCNLVKFVRDAGHDYDEQLDRVRPNCVEFCTYIESIVNQLSVCSDLDKMLDIEFTLQQLLQLLSCMDLSDQASRKTMEKLLHGILVSDHVGPSMISHILPCLKLLYEKKDNLITYVAETVSEIREPITTTQKHVSATEQRNLDKKIASIRLKLNQLREELGICVEQQDFERAALLKNNISELDAERSSLYEEAEPKMEEVRTLKSDPLTVLKCLTLVCELLTSVNIRTMTPALQALMESQILPGMVNEEAEVRNAAVKAIGLCCLMKKDIIMLHLPLILQATQMDTQLVRATALKCVFDLVHVYGLDAFSDDDNANKSVDGSVTSTSFITDKADTTGQDVTTETEDGTKDSDNDTSEKADKKGWSETASKIVTILSVSLDSESSLLRNIAAEGLAKLLLSGRVVSSKLFSHLLLLWFNPLVEDDDTLLQCLGVFFPLFAFSSSTNQELIEEAFLPTLKTLVCAPSTSPLAEINEVNVSSFLVELTNAQYLVSNQVSGTVVKDNVCHDSIAVKLSNEILSQPDSFNVILWLKTMNQLSISPDNITLLKDLSKMCEDMAVVITEKQCLKLFEKFRNSVHNNLDNMKKQSPLSDNTEKENTEVGDGTGDLVESITELDINKDSGDGNTKTVCQATPAVKKPKAMPHKTPMSKSCAPRTGSHLKSTKKVNSSELDNSVFTTPAQLRGSRQAADVEETRVCLENLLVESRSKTPALSGRTPKTPKRPLHSIQDPSFTG